MRLMQLHRKSWKADVALFLTLVMMFGPALLGLDVAWLGVAGKAAAQSPSTTAVQPILVVPLTPTEGVSPNIAGRVTFALVNELTASKRFAPTRLSLEEPTIRRLISEGTLMEETVSSVIDQPTPEGIAEIATAMNIPMAVYGTVDAYTYTPTNGGSVKVQLTVRFLSIDLETGTVLEEKTVEISEEGSSAPKLRPTPEETLAAEAIYDAVGKVLAKFLQLPAPKPPVQVRRAPGLGGIALVAALLAAAAALGGGRGRAAPPAVGPAGAPRSVFAVPSGNLIVVTWQPPAQGTPTGYHVYRALADLTTGQITGAFERLTASPVPATQLSYEDTTARVNQAYVYGVSAVFADGRESDRTLANLGIITATQPAPVGVGIPLPPTNLQATPRDAAVALAWQDPYNPAGLVIGYRVFRNGVLIADETTVRTTTYIDRGVQNGVTYQYVVRAVSAFNVSAPSAPAVATPGNLPPQAPVNLTARFDPTTKIVTLNWQPPTDPDIAYYEVARVLRVETRLGRGIAERAGRLTPTPSTSPTIIQRVQQTNPRLRQQAGSEFDNAVIASNIVVTFYNDSVAAFMPRPEGALTGYTFLRYAVRAVDTNGQKSGWSNVVQVVPNTPPPSLRVQPVRLIPGDRNIVLDLLPILQIAQADPEWQVDRKGVRIFRATTRGGTAAPGLRPIHPQDVLPLDQLEQGRFFRDTGLTNSTRYYYAVELVDKLDVAGERSVEAVATPFATATITILPQGNRRELSGNGQDQVSLTITVTDPAGRPVVGVPLQLSLTGVGSLTVDPSFDDPFSDDPNAVLTNESGQVIATYRAALVAADTTVTVTVAPGAGVSGITPAQLILTLRAPVVASVEVQPVLTQLVADGQSFTQVNITVRDRLGNLMPNQTIALSISPAQGRFEDLQGNSITQVSSGATGSVTVVYRSGTRAGSVTLTAAVGAIRGDAVINLVPGSPATIELVAVPTTAPADGQTEIRVTATVKDAQGNAVPNVQVRFTSTPTLTITPSQIATNETGQATVAVIAPRVAGSYLLRAQVGTISATLSLTFGASAPSIMTLSATRTNLVVSLPALPAYSGLAPFARTEITATVVDENNNPVSGVVVQFNASAGTIQATAITNEAGVARAIYVAPTGPAGQVSINAQAGAASASLTLDVLPGPPARVDLSASPLIVPADGRSQINLTATVRDHNGNPVADGTSVCFSARQETNIALTEPRIGSLLQDNVPTLNGQAQTALVAGTVPGVRARLVAQAFGTVFGQNFGPVPAEAELPALQTTLPLVQLGGQLVITLSATEMSVSSSDATNIPADRQPLRISEPRDNFVDLSVQLVDGQGNPAPLSGQSIYLTASDGRVLFVHEGGADLGTTVVTTDSAGQATARVYASRTAGPVVIAAELRDAQNRAFFQRSVTVRQRPGVPALVVVPTPQPSIIFVPGAGTPTSTIVSATVYDAANNLVEDGTLVRWSADAGTLTPSQSTTVNGRAGTTLSSTPDTGRFTVRAEASVPGQVTPATGTATVSFAVNVTQISVTANPTSILGDGTTTAQITATLVGAIPDNTRVQVSTDRGFIREVGRRSAFVPVVGNALAVTFYSEAVTADTTATVRVEAVNPQGIVVSGVAQITLRRPPQLPILQPIQVERATLSVSSTNALVPAQRVQLGPEPNQTLVTVTVLEQNLNLPVPNATVFLSSSDSNGLWVDAQRNASLGGIQVVTGSNGQATATYYASTTPGQVTLTARLGAQEQTATINVLPGNPASVVIDFSGTRTAPDGVPYIFVPGAGGPNQAGVTATVRDAVGNLVRDGTSVTFRIVEGEGTFTPTGPVTTTGGRASVTLASSSATGEFTVEARSGAAVGRRSIRYAADVPDIVDIRANPQTIADDGREESTITIRVPAPDGTRFRVATDAGILTTDSQTGSAVVATVTNEEATAKLKGPGNLIRTTTATVSAEIVILTGEKRSKSTQVTLLPRIEIVDPEFPLPNNSIVVSSSNSLDPAARLPLDGVLGNNKVRIRVIVNGTMPTNPAVSLLASEGNILFDVVTGSNAGTKRLATVSGNLASVSPNEHRYEVDMYASTLAGTFTLRIDVPGLGVQRTFTFNQLPGLPGAIVLSAANSLIGVQGHPSLPTTTQIIANVRDAVGNPVANAPVFFGADDGQVNPIVDNTDNAGVATTTLTSSNFTRRVRVFAKAIGAGGQEVIGFTTVSFVVGNLDSIDLVPDRADIPPNETATVTAIFNPATQMPNNVRFSAELTGAYGVLESVSTTLNGRATIRIRNNNPTTSRQTSRLTVRLIRQDGLEMTRSLDLNLLPTEVSPVVELSTNRSEIVVSNNDTTTNPADRQTLGPDPNNATLTLIVRNLNAGDTVAVTLETTDPRGLFVPPSGLASNSMGTLTFSITDDGAFDLDPTDGVIQRNLTYYSSRKAQPVTIRVTVNHNNALYGESAVGLFQKPGPVEKAFFAVDPPRLAVSTLTGEPTQSRLIASIYDANDNPVPNERVSFAIVDSDVLPYSDLLAGTGTAIALTRYDIPSFSEFFRGQGGSTAATNDWNAGVPRVDRYLGRIGFSPTGSWTGPTIPDPYYPSPGHPLTNHFYRLSQPSAAPRVADGGIGPQSEAYTDINGIAVTYLTSVNVCQPVTIRMVPQSNPTLARTYSTFYYVPVNAVNVFIVSGGLDNGPGATFTVEFRFSPASALPPGTRVWVRIHGTAYDGDEDGDGLVNEDPPGRNNWDDDKDGRIDEDPAGDANGDDDDDDDFDGQDDEDPPGPQSADDDGDGRTDEDWNPSLVDYFTTVTVGEPGIVRVSITNNAGVADWANGWKVIQVFVWNQDGIRLMGQTSPVRFYD